MDTLRVKLFGKLSIQRGDQVAVALDGPKLQEVFCYLLLHREQPLARDTLAGLFWGDSATAQAKKSLRQALWQLQTAIEPATADGARIILAEQSWVQVNGEAGLSVDVAAFERAYALAQDVPGELLAPPAVEALRHAVELYRGDLLDGWYHEWCLLERERLQNMYLSMLDKLMGSCEASHEYEAGLLYGARILRCDRAHERTHRRMMLLHSLAGDRVAALRQYQRCAAALGEEFGVAPSRLTVATYRRIQGDELAGEGEPDEQRAAALALGASSQVTRALSRLEQFSARLSDLQSQIYEDIKSLKAAMEQGGGAGEPGSPARP